LNLPTDTAINLEYNCSDSEKLTLQIVWDTLTLNDNKTRRLYNLERVVSADGEKFEDEINTIWLKGNEATFYRNSVELYKNCLQK
jgi:membrane-bound inhibitor of C-type lysozyme